MSTKKFKEFSVVKVKNHFWTVKNSNGVDVAMLVPQPGVSKGDITHYHVVSLSLHQPTGPVGLTRKKLEQVLNLTDNSEFRNWWQSEINGACTGTPGTFNLLGDGTIYGAYGGAGYVYGNLVALQLSLKTTKNVSNYSLSLTDELEMAPADAFLRANELEKFVSEKAKEFNNDSFSILNTQQAFIQPAQKESWDADDDNWNGKKVENTTPEEFIAELHKALTRADNFVRSHGESLGCVTDKFGIRGKIYPGVFIETEGPNIPHFRLEFDTVKYRTQLTFKYPLREIEFNGLPVDEIIRVVSEAFHA